MKSEHRHELKTNELADWLAHAPEWFKENSRILAGALAVIVVVAAIYYWNVYNHNIRLPEQRQQLTGLVSQLEKAKMTILQNRGAGQALPIALDQTIEDLGSFAQSTGHPTMAAMAYLQQAKGIRAQLHLRSPEPTAEETKQQIEAARRSYQKAHEMAGADRSILAAAEYGLGLCDEEVGKYEAARKTYEGILANADLAGTAVQDAVRYRLKVLPEIQTPVSFPPAPPTPEVTATEPTPVVPAAVPDIVGDAMTPILKAVPDSNGSNP